MAANPTKILAYDLDADLSKLIAELKQFQGTYETIYDRLMDLDTDTFTDELQKIIDDLVLGYQDGSILTIQRIENLKAKIESFEKKSPVSEDPSHEEYEYDVDQDVDVVTVYDQADLATRVKLYSTDYQYTMVNGNKEITTSITTIFDVDGTTVKETVTKVYAYDANNNVKSITTTVA